MDTTELHNAYSDFLATARSGRFGPPPQGEWTAEQLLAHVVAVDTAITAVALQVTSGQRPSYDNRSSLDGWNLSRISSGAAGLEGLADLVGIRGRLLCEIAGQLSSADLQVQVATLILSKD